MLDTTKLYRAKLVLDFENSEAAEKYYKEFIKELRYEDFHESSKVRIRLFGQRVTIIGGEEFTRIQDFDVRKETTISL